MTRYNTPANRTVLPHESRNEFDAHLDALLDVHQPRDYHERLIVEEYAEAAWNWQRARAVETDLWFQLGTSYGPGTGGIAEAQFHVPEQKYRTHRREMLDAERRYREALKAVEHMRDRRELRDSVRPPDEATPAPAQPERTMVVAAAATAPVRNEAKPVRRARSPRVAATLSAPERNEPNSAEPIAVQQDASISTAETKRTQPASAVAPEPQAPRSGPPAKWTELRFVPPKRQFVR